MSTQIQRFFKKHTPFLTLLTGILTAFAWLSHQITGWDLIPTIGYLIVTVLCGVPILLRAVSGLRMRAIGIELLVSIAVIGALLIGEYSEAGIVTFLFQLGGYLEQKTLEKTRQSIRALTEMAPATAWKMEQGVLTEIDVEDVCVGDHLFVKTGNQIPVDGTIYNGEGYLNEASITGESVLAHKKNGEMVYAGTILDSGTLEMIATRVGEDTTFSKIIALVEEAQDAKSPVERFIDRFAKWYTPAVAVLALSVGVILRDIPLRNHRFGTGLSRCTGHWRARSKCGRDWAWGTWRSPSERRRQCPYICENRCGSF